MIKPILSLSLNDFIDNYSDVIAIKGSKKEILDLIKVNDAKIHEQIKEKNAWATIFIDPSDNNRYLVTEFNEICTISLITNEKKKL